MKKRSASIVRLLYIILFFGVFACEKPGLGPKAEKGYQACNPIIEALGRYHNKHHEYPNELSELAPEFIEKAITEVNGLPILYRRNGKGFELRFSYEGPGMNKCNFSPATKWECLGYY